MIKQALMAGIELGQLWVMTPGETFTAVRANTEKLKQRWRMLATHASWVISPHVKKGSRVGADDLLGRKKFNPAGLGGNIAAIKKHMQELSDLETDIFFEEW